VKMPHGACGRRMEALRRVAEHCPVHETIHTIEEVEFVFLDREELKAAA
jgi:putative redox protein